LPASGDRQGKSGALFERRCRCSGRHQKLSRSPHPTRLESGIPNCATESARGRLRHRQGPCGNENAGTVRFLVDGRTANCFYFIEGGSQSRIQVEHTVTEEFHGIASSNCQLLIAGGERGLMTPRSALGPGHRALPARPGIRIPIAGRGRPEEPSNNFMPDLLQRNFALTARPAGNGNSPPTPHGLFRERSSRPVL